MKKIKSPWYGVAWIIIWTAALVWMVSGDLFSFSEKAALVVVWVVMVGCTVYVLIQNYRRSSAAAAARLSTKPKAPALNAPCPCGSGKNYKRCCGAKT